MGYILYSILQHVVVLDQFHSIFSHFRRLGYFGQVGVREPTSGLKMLRLAKYFNSTTTLDCDSFIIVKLKKKKRERRTEDAATFFSFQCAFPSDSSIRAPIEWIKSTYIEGRRRSNISRAITWAQSTEFERRISYGWPSFFWLLLLSSDPFHCGFLDWLVVARQRRASRTSSSHTMSSM